MKINLRQSMLISHLLPGCFFLLIWLLAYNHWDFEHIKKVFKELEPTELIGTGIVMIIAAFLFGEIFDSARDGLIEGWIEGEKYGEINWDVFFDPEKEKAFKLMDDYGFTYYFFNWNSAISLLAGAIITTILMWNSIPKWEHFLWILPIYILYKDALVLRKSLVKETNKHKYFVPHDGVYTRIKPSTITLGGVGVFCIMPITKGNSIYSGDADTVTVEILRSSTTLLPAPIQKMYKDFCPVEGDKYICPSNFSQLTMAWYMNHSDTPNVEVRDLLFYALRDIGVDEELTFDYKTLGPGNDI